MSVHISNAITVGAVEVADWEAMGEYLAEQNSNDQAYLLMGFWTQVSDNQVPFIAESGVFGRKGEPERSEIADFYRSLADAIENGGVL